MKKYFVFLKRIVVVFALFLSLIGCGFSTSNSSLQSQSQNDLSQSEKSYILDNKEISVRDHSVQGGDAGRHHSKVLSASDKESDSESDSGRDLSEGVSDADEDSAATSKEAFGNASSIKEEGIYTSKEDVARYIQTYNKLPSNFITKKEARNLGWSGGSLDEYAKNKCIGGDRFGNYEGLLPKKKGRIYYECDIDTLNAAKRGSKRIIFSNDGLIYYTSDHYKTFEEITNGKFD